MSKTKRKSFPLNYVMAIVGGASCTTCGIKWFLNVDHIIPLARGDSNQRDNLQPLCRWCNHYERPSLASWLAGNSETLTGARRLFREFTAIMEARSA